MTKTELIPYLKKCYAEPNPYEVNFESGWHECVNEIEAQLDEPKTCHMKRSYQGQDIKDITIMCSECGGHLGSTANAVKHFAKFCKNCGAKIDFSKGVEL